MGTSSEKLIFVSCGQVTQEERELGCAIRDVIDGTSGFAAYVALTVHDLEGLGDNIFSALRGCSGIVAVLHSRGEVGGSRRGRRVTSSIWVNQEIAILAYRRWLEGTAIPIRVFKEPAVNLEGAITSLIVNPIDLISMSGVTNNVRQWLSSEQFVPLLEDAEFQRLVAELDDGDWKVVQAVFAGGAISVSDSQVKKYLRDEFNIDDNKVAEILRSAKLRFTSNNLLRLRVMTPRQRDVFEVNPSWQWDLRRELAKCSRGGQ